ncbi:YrvL family regulatory protein [Sporosarcina sp. P19]|uniref:YrvL family regulatory protein n=1 Tax=Sporosarcina sp. P19 TaxID=2048258 RepID=UPI001E4882E2|nr:YrvL family regulatory protein [Sporosarcina sp. P19]
MLPSQLGAIASQVIAPISQSGQFVEFVSRKNKLKVSYSKEEFTIKKLKTFFICTSIVLIILLSITFFEYIFLRLLGLQYDSIGALLFFFVLYLFFEIPLSLITNAIPKALKSVGIIKSSKGWLVFILNISLTFTLIGLLDHFMENIEISIQGVFIFALISGFLSWKLSENDVKPPDVESKEFKELEDKFNT